MRAKKLPTWLFDHFDVTFESLMCDCDADSSCRNPRSCVSSSTWPRRPPPFRSRRAPVKSQRKKSWHRHTTNSTVDHRMCNRTVALLHLKS